MRALAALAVVVGHVRALFFVPYGELASVSLPIKALYFVTGFGHEAVIVFFVLSGFLIATSVVRLIRDSRWSWRRYTIQRATRLYIVLIPALLLTALWDQLGLHFFGSTGIYHGTASDAIVPYVVAERTSIWIAILNGVFLQSIFTVPFGSNGPLWSLSFEFWYYVLFPITVFLLVEPDWRRRVAAGVVAGTIFWMVGPSVRLYYLIWLMGAGLALLPARMRSGRFGFPWRLGTAAVLLVVLCLIRFEFVAAPASDFAVGFSVSLLLFGLLRGVPDSRASAPDTQKAPPLGTRLARFSYTLYLVHLPLLVLMARAITGPRREQWQPDALHTLLTIGITVAVIGYAMLIARFTEDRTDQLRRALTS